MIMEIKRIFFPLARTHEILVKLGVRKLPIPPEVVELYQRGCAARMSAIRVCAANNYQGFAQIGMIRS
jgi:hypothetical protein